VDNFPAFVGLGILGRLRPPPFHLFASGKFSDFLVFFLWAATSGAWAMLTRPVVRQSAFFSRCFLLASFVSFFGFLMYRVNGEVFYVLYSLDDNSRSRRY